MFFRQPQSGLDASFGEIVREHQAMVYSIGWHLLGDKAVAEELAQDVFLKLFENWDSLESRAHVTNWLRRAMTQRAIDYSRRAKFRPRFGLDGVQEPAGPAYEADPLMNGHLESLIARLPERARQIVVLRYQEDLEPTEIAKTLGLSVGAVKSNLHRSLAWMRGRMERMGVTK
jgi:RNA polymerase sigma-70 factor (ECF subfamily)